MMGSERVLCGKVFYNRYYIPEILRLQGPLFIAFRFEMTWSASRNIQISKHSFVRTTQDESYCTSYSMEQPIFNLVYRRWEHYRLKRTASPPWKHRAAVLIERQWMWNLMSYGFACRSNSFQKNAFFVVNAADSVRAIAVYFRDGNFAACFRHSIYPRTVPRVHVFQSLLNVMCSKLRKSVDSPQLDGFTLHMRFHRAWEICRIYKNMFNINIAKWS